MIQPSKGAQQLISLLTQNLDSASLTHKQVQLTDSLLQIPEIVGQIVSAAQTASAEPAVAIYFAAYGEGVYVYSRSAETDDALRQALIAVEKEVDTVEYVIAEGHGCWYIQN